MTRTTRMLRIALTTAAFLGLAALEQNPALGATFPQDPAPAPARKDPLHQMLDNGRPKDAELEARRRLAEADAAGRGESPESAELLDVLVEALVGQKRTREAETRALAERALRVAQATLGSDDLIVARVSFNLAKIVREQGDLPASEMLNRRALAIREARLGPDSLDVAKSLVPLAGVLKDMGKFAEAKPLYERSIEIRERLDGPESAQLVPTLVNFGDLLIQMGNLAGAKESLNRALRLQEKVDPEHVYVAHIVSYLGVSARTEKEFELERDYFKRALKVQEKTGGPVDRGAALSRLSLARLSQEAGDLKGAKQEATLALEILRKLFGEDSRDVAYGEGLFGDLLAAGGDLAEARIRYQHVLAINERIFGPDHPTTARTLISLATVKWSMSEPGPALEDAFKAEAIARDHFLRTSRRLTEREALRFEAMRVSGLDLALTILSEKPQVSAADVTRAWNAVIRSRAMVLDEMAARHRFSRATGDPAITALVDALNAARDNLADVAVQGPGSSPPAEYQERLTHAQQAKERAERALAAKSSDFEKELVGSRAGMLDLAGKLPDRFALVSFVQYDHVERLPATPEANRSGNSGTSPGHPVATYLAFVLAKDARDPVLIQLGAADRINQLIEGWRREASRGPSGTAPTGGLSERTYREAGARLREAVWDPVVSRIRGSRGVLVVPDATLHLVSLATLPSAGDRYLVETGPLFHYLSAERDIMRGRGVGPVGTGLFALGGPDFDARPADVASNAVGSSSTPDRPVVAAYRGLRAACADFQTLRFESLPSSLAEVEEIVSLWEKKPESKSAPNGGVLKLSGPSAGEAAFKENATGRKVLHLATHAFLLDGRCPSGLSDMRTSTDGLAGPTPAPSPAVHDNPLLLTGLALAGANRRDEVAPGADIEDGVLTAEEIGSLDLSGTEWAVLSACETGGGRVQAGEGVLGLQRAFATAGVQTLIMSLWPVEDESTRAWMQALYGARVEGSSTAEAVRRASLRIIEAQRGRKLTSHPFFWGGFIASGNWR